MNEQLKQKAAEIRDERDPGENTAQRVGEALVGMVGAIDGLQQAVEKKVDKATGKGLSTNDYTDEDKKLVKQIPTLKAAAAGGFSHIHAETSEDNFTATFSDAAETVEQDMTIPAATNEKAGVMTPSDKRNIQSALLDVDLIQKSSEIEFTIETVGGQQRTMTIPSATKTLGGILSAEDKNHLDNAITGVSFQERTDQIAVQYIYPSGPGGTDSVFPMASAANAGAMSADDKQTVETLKGRMSEIVANVRTEPKAKNVNLLLDKLGSGTPSPVSLPAATTELAGVMTAKDKKKVEKPYKKLVVGRAISPKAKKGMRYFFADGVIKIRYNSRHLKEFTNLIETFKKQGMNNFSYDDGGYYFISVKELGTHKSNEPKSAIVTITGNPPITLDKIEIERVDPEMYTCLETASPFLFIRNGVIVRNCPIGKEEAIKAIRKLYAAELKTKEGKSYIPIRLNDVVVRRLVRATLYHKEPWKKKKNVWKLIRTSKRFQGVRVRVWKKHRGKISSNWIELHVRIPKGGKRALSFKPI